MSSYTTSPSQQPLSAAIPRLPDWAPVAKVNVSVSTTGDVYVDLTVTWGSMSKTWHFQIAGTAGAATLVTVGQPTVTAAQDQIEAGSTGWPGTENVGRLGYEANPRAGTWNDQERRVDYYGVAEPYLAGDGSVASVPRYAADEQWNPGNQGRDGEYGGLYAGEERFGGERMDRKSEGKGKGSKAKVHAGERKRK